jgi:hypothetical protein
MAIRRNHWVFHYFLCDRAHKATGQRRSFYCLGIFFLSAAFLRLALLLRLLLGDFGPEAPERIVQFGS